MQSSTLRTDSPSRIPRMRGVSNSSARKYSQSQERDRTPSLEGRPSLSKASGGALPVPLARRAPALLSAHAIGEATPPRAPHISHAGQHLSTSGAVNASGARPRKAAVRISQLPRTPRSRHRAHGAGGNHSTSLLATASNRISLPLCR